MIFICGTSFSADRYVVAPGTGGTNVGPYTDWGIAATQIQWAVDAATNSGDTVYIGGGSTVTACRVTDNIVTGTVGYATGYGRGGGIFAYGPGCEIVNCVISNNILYARSNIGYGDGAYLYYTTIRSSMICNNDGQGGYGGGVYLLGGLMESCTSTVNKIKRGGTSQY